MSESRLPVDISAIVPVGGRHADPVELYAEYRAGLEALGRSYEIIFVLDGPREKFAGRAQAPGSRRERIHGRQPHAPVSARPRRSWPASSRPPARSSSPSPPTTRSTPLSCRSSSAPLSDCDLAIARRWPRAGGPFERLRRGAFHGLLGWRDGPAIPRPRLRRPRLRSPRAGGDPALRRPAPLPAGTCGPQGLPGPRNRRPAVAARTITRASTSPASTRAGSSTFSRSSSWCASRRSRCGSSA